MTLVNNKRWYNVNTTLSIILRMRTWQCSHSLSSFTRVAMSNFDDKIKTLTDRSRENSFVVVLSGGMFGFKEAKKLVFLQSVLLGSYSLETFPGPANVIFCVYIWFHLNFLEQLPLVEQYHAVNISSTWLDPERVIGKQLVSPRPISHTMIFTTTRQVNK